MKSRYLLVLGLVAIFCLCGSAFATDYYVATNGDDGWPGTEAQPWATLDYAVDQIAPGDTILVKSGTYAGCRIENSGLSGAVCTLKADAGATVIIDAPGATARHTSNVELEWYDNTVRYWVIDGIEVTGAPKHGFDLRTTEHITIQNCYVHDSVVGTGIFMAFSYYPILENNESSYNGEHGMYQSNSGDYHEMRGNLIHDNYGCGIHMNGDEHYKPGDGLISYGIIEYNVIYGNGTGGGAAINGDGAWYTMIQNNLVHSNLAGGITLFDMDGAAGSSYNEIYN
ncbi:MAG: right-handed parallel beta-helix repeat-containing protein, partial [Proteobacteria bacterium]|nr:right-handed parallel beta-helix repeat-containing protein [Pseudomonadota bacterium]